ncbi:lebercilin-like isoform X3 [Elysia marginata]|uniref:Lebercilin-like isoform X3 n=1 Tax=Elysia marginata TaxID=1093978 RepID=A0AAV4FKR1_9GAST|nr:lebercilin-like isoform X3 [Elysia marginata]
MQIFFVFPAVHAVRGGRGRGAISRGRGRGQLQGRRRGGLRGRGNSRNSEPADMRRLDNVTTRVMSASRNKINELRNKEKDKALDYNNIYSNPNRNRSRTRDSSPNESPGRSRARGVKSKASSLTDLTPRDKAKFYAEKKRAELLKQKEELEKRRDQEHKERKEKDDRERREKEDFERRQREKEERDMRERGERERREREESERREREREEQERRARLEREKMDNDPVLMEERRKKDELLRKLQAMDTLGSAGNDPLPPGSSSPSRRSKESSRLGGGDAFDTASKKSDPKEYSFTNPVKNLHKGVPSHDVSHAQRQPQAGRKPTTLPSGLGSAQDDSAGYQPSFGPPGGVRGGPKATNASKPLSIFDDDDDDVGAFKISANSSKTAAASGNKKSSNLLENLFGPQASSNNNASKNTSSRKIEDDKTFFVTSQASPSPTFDSRRKGNMSNGVSTTNFPWDAKTNSSSRPANNKFSFENSKQENSSQLFGGGAALIDDDFSSANGKILPKRRQQANLNTFSSKPSVIAMDNFDDDLEEVVL